MQKSVKKAVLFIRLKELFPYLSAFSLWELRTDL